MASLDPLGYSSKDYDAPLVTHAGGASATRDSSLLYNRAMELARGQMGVVFQSAFVLYLFVPNQLNLFSIMFLFTMGLTPFRNLFAMDQTFAPLSSPNVNLLAPKLLFIALNLAGVGVFAWKVRAMGLLPVSASDWAGLFPARTHAEMSAGVMEL